MKIILQSKNNDVLKADFISLESNIILPCSFSHSYQELDDDNSNLLAATIHGKTQEEKKATDIKFFEQYFQLSSDERQIILLHELIHACQRSNSLKDWNTKVNTLVNKYNSLRNYLYSLGVMGNLFVKVKFNLSTIIKFLAFGIFELWNDLLFKQKYPDFFESNMNLVHSQISFKVEQLDFTKANKYAIFFELLRADHYTKMSQGLVINKKFYELFEFYIEKLSKIVDTTELLNFKDRLSELNNSEHYPNSKKLSEKYEEYIKEQWMDEIDNDSNIQKIKKNL